MRNQHTFIRTVLGDIAPAEAGICYAHEHIIIDESFPTVRNELFLLNDLEKIISELKAFYASGGRTMVDTMPADAGRNILKLAEVSRRSGVNIVAPTGLHLEEYYLPNHWRYHYSEEQLARLFIDDITIGIDEYDYNGPLVKRSSYKAGMIKLATGDDPISLHQEKIFRAVVAAHLETGAPILTHTNFGKQALEQAAQFEKLGADLSHVVISHTDRYKDIGYHRALLQTGVCVEYDSAFRWPATGDNFTYKLLEALLPEFRQQITMGMDAAKRSYWKSYGGKPGLSFLLIEFKKDLEKMGMGEYYPDIFINNPARLYQFSK